MADPVDVVGQQQPIQGGAGLPPQPQVQEAALPQLQEGAGLPPQQQVQGAAHAPQQYPGILQYAPQYPFFPGMPFAGAYFMPQAVPAFQPQAGQGNGQMPNPGWDAYVRAIYGPQAVLPEFCGAEHEQPERYLQQCEEYCQTLQIPNHQRTRALEEGLKDDAATWWAVYRDLDFEWAQFRELLLRRFDSRGILSDLTAQLYSKKQGDREGATSFIQKKYRLFQRLQPNEAEAIKIDTILGLMRPSLRRCIRPRHPVDIADFLSKAMEAEKDDEEEKQFDTRPRAVDRKPYIPAPRKEATKEERPLPKCWYCPERHFNRDCPIRRQQSNPPAIWHQPMDPFPATARPPEIPIVNTMEAIFPRTDVQIARKNVAARVDTAPLDNYIHPNQTLAPAQSFTKPMIMEVSPKKSTLLFLDRAVSTVPVDKPVFHQDLEAAKQQAPASAILHPAESDSLTNQLLESVTSNKLQNAREQTPIDAKTRRTPIILSRLSAAEEVAAPSPIPSKEETWKPPPPKANAKYPDIETWPHAKCFVPALIPTQLQEVDKVSTTPRDRGFYDQVQPPGYQAETKFCNKELPDYFSSWSSSHRQHAAQQYEWSPKPPPQLHWRLPQR